jgi:CBS domain containing-hemolysin-like protein
VHDFRAPAATVDPSWTTLPWSQFAAGLACLIGVVACGFLEEALRGTLASRLLSRVRDSQRRVRLAKLLEHSESHALSAALLRLALELGFFISCLWIPVERDGWSFGDLVSPLLLGLPVLLLCGRILPGALAGPRTDGFLLRVLPWFAPLSAVLSIAVWPLIQLRRMLLRVVGRTETSAEVREIVQEIKEVIEESAMDGTLAASERSLLTNVFDLHDVDVAAVMTPRTEIVALDQQTPLGVALERLAASGHGRLPVFQDSLDRIIGIAGARELLRATAEGVDPATPVLCCVRPALFVPETKRVSALLPEMRAANQRVAIALDEYGGTAGLVTLGDILDELVPDAASARPSEGPIQIVRDGSAEAEGATRIAEVNERLNLELPTDAGYETLAGFVLTELGRVPRRGETFQRRGREFSVLEATDRRILRLRIRSVEATHEHRDSA